MGPFTAIELSGVRYISSSKLRRCKVLCVGRPWRYNAIMNDGGNFQLIAKSQTGFVLTALCAHIQIGRIFLRDIIQSVKKSYGFTIESAS
jgi:hypothetical protein